MGFFRPRERRASMRQRTNDAVRSAAERMDNSTGRAGASAARTLALTVRLLRIPSLIIAVISMPFIIAVILLGLAGQHPTRFIAVGLGVVMAIMWLLFLWRRHVMLRAVEDESALGTQLAIMVQLAGASQDAQNMLTQLSSRAGFAVFAKFRRFWSDTEAGQRWIQQIDDLDRAKWFGPPRIGTTITLALTALWLIPISLVVCLFTLIGVVSGSL